MRTVTAAGLPIGDDHPPRIMGVLNLSEESPYDGSVHADPGEAAAYVDEALVGEGADIVDVGLASANKRFEVLSAEAELDRLETAVETVASTSGDVVWSIETRYHEVADAALSAGFDMVNDVCGFADPEMPRVCAEYDAAVSKMASPPDIRRPGAVGDGNRAAGRADGSARRRGHADDVYEALARNGFTDKTLVDPAFGGWSAAKTLADDRETFDRLREFRGLGRPILVSINRKNFLKDVVDRDTDGALPASLAATAMAVERGADVVRTHDVAATRDAARIGHEFTRDRLRDPAVGVAELDVTTDAEFRRHRDRVSGGDGVEADDAVVTRVVEVDLPPVAAEHVATAARRAGIDVYGDETLLLAGEDPQFRSLHTASNDAPEAAERAIERLSGGFE